MKQYVIYLFFFSLVSLFMMNCSDPNGSDKKKETVIILVDDIFEDTGLYVFFWDGKDKNKKYVEPGNYIYAMQTKQYENFFTITAEAGGKVNANMEEHFEPGFWNSTELLEAYPNPFKINAGVNIPFHLSSPAQVRITIFKE